VNTYSRSMSSIRARWLLVSTFSTYGALTYRLVEESVSSSREGAKCRPTRLHTAYQPFASITMYLSIMLDAISGFRRTDWSPLCVASV
jgi:hypothetical protein